MADSTDAKPLEIWLRLKAQLLDSISDAIFVYDTGGKFVYVNEMACQSHGYSRSELMGMSRYALVAPQHLAHFDSQLKELAEKGERLFRCVHVRKNRATMSMEIHSYIMEMDGKKLILDVTRDITEHKQEESLFKTLADSSPVNIYIVQDGKFRYVSPWFLKSTGYCEDELLGLNPLDFVHPEDRSKVRETAVLMLKGKDSTPYEYRLISKAGDTRWMMESVVPIQYLGRRASLGSAMDITEIKKMEKKVLQYQELDRLKNDLLSNISHELKSPLTSIKGIISTFAQRDIKLDEATRDMLLKGVSEETDRLISLVTNLLDMSRLNAGAWKPEKGLCNISDIINEVLTQEKWSHRNHIFCTEVEPDLPEIYADYSQIRQVLANLLENAVAYSEESTVITTGARVVHNEIEVSISDQGVGIPQEELQKIFDKFYRGSQKRHTPGGTGLGLSICRAIIQAHGGRIWVESKPSAGSTFFFSLPISGDTACHGTSRVELP
jgi:PAS domain S-box-containing protein